MTITPRKALAGLIVAGALTLAGAAPAGAKAPPGPGGTGVPAICVQVPAFFNGTTPAGGPGYGFFTPPPASDQAYDRVSCPPPSS
jgi:hypothetical protein